MSEAELTDTSGNDVDQELLIRDHLGCFLQELSGHIAQGTDGRDGFRREPKNCRRIACDGGWKKTRSKHR